MPLLPGDRLGPYEILAPVGAGGMGQVYRARDTRLHREVAIKVSAEQFSERFAHETRAIASLNHLNICTLHDVGPNYLVMELVEGPTLADRIREGAMQLEEALAVARQLVYALEAAHEKGIIHRDLKPANIKIKSDGTVKVLDFGLARITEPAAASANPSDSPTRTLEVTRAGQIVGTVAYMSPEQARGQTVDKRTDIWAFGVVLYEMLAGQRLFETDTASDTVVAVLTKEPDWTRVPAQVERLLRRCLEKDVRQRLRDIADVWTLLDEAPPTTPAGKAPRVALKAMLIVTGLAVAFAAGLWAPWRSVRPVQPAESLVRLDVDLGAGVLLGSLGGADAILSPDGSRIVYCSNSRLFTRRLDQAEVAELPGTQGAWAPFFSPDGQWVGFFASGALKKTPVEGGAAITLCNAPFGLGASWGEDGNIVAALTATGVLSQIPSAGGVPTPVTELAAGEVAHRWPQVLPGGRAAVFSTYAASAGFGGARIDVVSLADRRRKTVHVGGAYGRYVPDGHLVYINNGTLFAVPFDLDRLEVRGAPAPVIGEIAYNPSVGSAQFDCSRTGTLVYRKGGAGTGVVTLQWVDPAGRTRPLFSKPGDYAHPRLSPDGNRVALVSAGDIWVYEWKRDTMTRLTFDGSNGYPFWSPDGTYIAFHSGGHMYLTRSDGSEKPQPLAQSVNIQYPWSFTADGKRLAFIEQRPETGFDIWTALLESDGTKLRAGKPELFLQTPFDERQAVFSPDGRWLAYTSNESGAFQVYVGAFPGPGRKWQISSNGGQYPAWSRANELFFQNADHQVMVAAYTVKDGSFLAQKPRVWYGKRLANIYGWNFDVAADGKSVMAVMPAEDPQNQTPQNQIVFLLNFFNELHRRAPAGTH